MLLNAGGQALAAPIITSPASATTLSGPDVSVSWSNNGTAVKAWWLYAGTFPGSNDLFDSQSLAGTANQTNITDLPQDGSPIHLRLWYRPDSTWLYLDTTVTANGESPISVSPNNGSQLNNSTQSFSWNSQTSVQNWWVQAGDASGQANYYDSGLLTGSTSSVQLSGLPADSSKVHISLWYKKDQSTPWTFKALNYTAAAVSTLPTIQQPASGTVLSGSSMSFQWQSNGFPADQWWVYAGSSAGASDIHDSGALSSSTTSATIQYIPLTGQTVFVRLWYRTANGNWAYLDRSYGTQNTSTPPSFSAPSPASTLGSSAVFSWSANGSAVSQWWLYVGSAAGATDIFDSGLLSQSTTQQTVNAIPVTGNTVYARLWYVVSGGSWQYIDQQFDSSGSSLPDISDYELVFSDEFSGSSLDPTKWDTGLLWGPYFPINNEEQLYVDTLGMHSEFSHSPFEFTGSTLKITATATDSTLQPPVRPDINSDVWRPRSYSEYNYNPTVGQPGDDGYKPGYDPDKVNYLSGIITSYGSFKTTHGYVEARAKLPPGKGLWPAFWLLPTHYVKDVPEIDVMEFLGQDVDRVYHTYHYFNVANNWEKVSTPSYPTYAADWTEDFHTFGMAWSPRAIVWYVDGVETRRITDSEYKIANQAMYLIANLAVGGWWPGTPDDANDFPATFEIDYIRAYKRKLNDTLDLAGDYQLMFNDEFNGNSLNPAKWNTSFLWGPYLPINDEEQYYVDALGSDSALGYSPFSVSGGNLTITARKADDPVGIEPPASLPGLNDTIWTDYPTYQRNTDYAPQNYTSGIITSYDSFKFANGYAEIRAHFPKGAGQWPAFWLLNGYYVGPQPEIDIMEVRGELPNQIVHSYHRHNSVGVMLSDSYTTDNGETINGYADGFHRYGARWEPGKVTWYIDGVPVQSYTGADVGYQVMYVIANLAVGGAFNYSAVDPSRLPTQFVIDYIRVYQEKDTPQ